MPISRRVLCIVYGLIGVVALVGCWGNNVQYLNLNLGILGVNAHFWAETLVNPASRSITIDILFLSLAAIIWMLLEARRLAMRGVWIYVLLGAFVAISAAYPAFMIHRERVLAKRDGSSSAGMLSAGDMLGVTVLGVCILMYALIALGR